MNSAIYGFLQARILEWVAFPISRGSSQPRDRTQVSSNAGGFLPAEPAVGSISKGPPFPCPLGTGFPLEEHTPGGLFFLTELLISRAEGAMYLMGKLGERTRQTNPVSSWVPLISELVVQVPLLPSREDRRTCAWRWNHATQTRTWPHSLLAEITPGLRSSMVAQMVKSLPAMQETQVWSLGWGALLEKGMATHSSILAWTVPRTEEPGQAPVHGVRGRQDLVTNSNTPGLRA